MNTFLVVVSMVSLVMAVSSNLEWNKFKEKYCKVYKNKEEENFRQNIFLENQRKIEEHNKNYEKGIVSYKLRMNIFGDLMANEIKHMMNGFKPDRNRRFNLFPLSMGPSFTL